MRPGDSIPTGGALQDDLPEVTIHTDGGADPNPGPGGWGVVLVHAASGKRQELHGGEPQTTNNRMELTAAIRALEALSRRCRVRLVTDSLYLRKGITEWLPGWILRGWKRKDGALLNEDLWRRLAELVTLHEVSWGWVKGHSGHRENERADRLATQAIAEQRAAAPFLPSAAAAPEASRAPEVQVFLRVATSAGRGAWGALLLSSDGERFLSGTLAGATPNALDLVAAASVLESLPAGARVALYTPSDYLRQGAARWLAGWKRAGWKTAEGVPVKNRDHWQRLDAAQSRRQVAWPAVKGQELPELERAAAAARDALRPRTESPTS